MSLMSLPVTHANICTVRVNIFTLFQCFFDILDITYKNIHITMLKLRNVLTPRQTQKVYFLKYYYIRVSLDFPCHLMLKYFVCTKPNLCTLMLTIVLSGSRCYGALIG